METLDASLVKEVEDFIFEAWDMGMAGNTLMNYVCAMARQPSFIVEPILNGLVNRMMND